MFPKLISVNILYMKFLRLIFFFFVLFLAGRIAFTSNNSSGKENKTKENWLDKISLNLDIDNITYDSLKKEFKANFEIEITNVNQDKFMYDLDFSYSYDKDRDIYDNSEVIDTETDLEFNFKINRIILKKLGLAFLFKMNNEKENSDYTNVIDFDISPIGFIYYIINSENIYEFSISYFPTLNIHQYYPLSSIPSYSLGNLCSSSLLLLSSLKEVREKTLHHLFKIIFDASFFNEKIDIKNKLYFKIAHILNEDNNDFDDISNIIVHNKFKITYNFSDNFSIGYKYEFKFDERRTRDHLVPAIDNKNAIVLSFSWN